MDILTALRQAGRGMDDAELAALLGIDPQEALRRCRRLAFQGVVIRELGSDGSIVNRLDGGGTTCDPGFGSHIGFPVRQEI